MHHKPVASAVCSFFTQEESGQPENLLAAAASFYADCVPSQATLVPKHFLGESTPKPHPHRAVIAARRSETILLQHFSSLNLCKPLLDAIAQQGYDTPTPIQAQAIPPAMDGRDLLGCAQTGTGKTAAFALPILHRLQISRPDKNRRGAIKPRALILSPTRELASQIDESFGVYGKYTSFRHTVIFGGVKQFHQVRKIRSGVHILTATPGRLLDLIGQRLVDLREVEIFVLDEADRMLDMGFIHPIREIASLLPVDRQTLLFSATMPRNIMHLADSLLTDPIKVAVTPVASAAPLIEQSIYMVPKAHKRSLMEHLLCGDEITRALVFTRTKHGADKLTQKLNRAGINTEAIHGNKPQNKRIKALEAFRSGRARVLVATDVAARGLDVDGISHVFNFDLPHEPESYVHRIGRTGRAGATGLAISFCDKSERGHLRAIERLIDQRIEITQLPDELNIAEESHAYSEARPHPRRTQSRRYDERETEQNRFSKPRPKPHQRNTSKTRSNTNRPKRSPADSVNQHPRSDSQTKNAEMDATTQPSMQPGKGVARPKVTAQANTNSKPSSKSTGKPARAGNRSSQPKPKSKPTAKRNPNSRASRKKARISRANRRPAR